MGKYHLINDSILLDNDSLMDIWNEYVDRCWKLPAHECLNYICNLAKQLDIECPEKPVDMFSSVIWSQLNEMKNEGLDIGCHSVTHPILSSLDIESLGYEVKHSSERIYEMLSKKPEGFCYPYGRIQEVNKLVISAVQEYGVLACNFNLNKDCVFSLGRLPAPHNYANFKWAVSDFYKPKGLPLELC